ncbi:hypothetical protein ACH47X_04245 [Promicromonospora kroppenstedtii]|uniref:SipW-cognate class signal peptide n=1 Tax=Promicromonospora kroppenstedtii TaxID=440482 RepID=A0ABW7XFF9_9MICO
MTLTPRGRFTLAAVACVAVLAATVIALLVGADRAADMEGKGEHDVSSAGKSFVIRGDAGDPLSPGRSAPIDVELVNRAHGDLRVTGLRVRVRDVTAPHADERRPCSEADFAVSQMTSDVSVIVPARATRSLSALGVPRRDWPRVRMIDHPVNQDGCKGASVTLSYVGSGRSLP